MSSISPLCSPSVGGGRTESDRSPSNDTDEALQDPQARHLQLLVSASHPTMGEFRTVRPPVSFDGERSLSVRPPPTLGEHNGEIDDMLRSAQGTS